MLETTFRQFLGHNFPILKPCIPVADNRVRQTAASALAALVAFKALNYQGRYKESRREQLTRIFLKFATFRKKYLEELNEKTKVFAEKFIESWAQFGKPFLKIPDQGLSPSEVLEIINSYANATEKNLKDVHMSGAIYGASLTSDPDNVDSNNVDPDTRLKLILAAQESITKDKFACYDEIISREDLSLEDYLKKLNLILKDLYAEATKLASSWNSLHSDDFPIGGFLDFQLIQMVGEMFGADPNEVVGEVTSGGTMSILEAMIMYRKRAEDLGHIEPGEGIILGSKYSHAAFSKAASDHHTKFVEVASTSDGKMDTNDLERKVKEHGKKVICVVASAPNYPTGTIDPIKDILEITQKKRLPVHVDACLGGFVTNFSEKLKTKYLNRKEFSGVMSVSCDFHKYGEAPKGASVVIGYPELLKYGVRTVANWPGGRYATLGPEGSKSCLGSLFSLVTLLIIGKNGYRKIATKLFSETARIKECLKGDNRIKIIGSPEVSVVAFELAKKKSNREGFPKGSTLELANQMGKQVVLNKLRDDRVHMCVTPRFLSDPIAFQKFQEALGNAIAEVVKLKNQGKIKAKDSGGYVQIAEMHSPKMQGSPIEYLQNWLIGMRAASDILRIYFLYKSNPTIPPAALMSRI